MAIKEAAKRRTNYSWPVGPTLTKMESAHLTLAFVHATVNYAASVEGTPTFYLDPARSREAQARQRAASRDVAFEPHTVRICDARPIQHQFSLDREGFALVTHHSAIARTPELKAANLNHEMERSPINDAYHDEVAAFLQDLTGARAVIGQKSGLLYRTSPKAKDKTWAPPAGFVHLDYVPATAEMFRDLSIEAEGLPLRSYRRFAVYQTWRVLSPPPQDNTLAICDGQSVPASDAIVFHAVVGSPGVPGSEFDSRMCKYRPDHLWYYFSDMHPDELLIFKGYDSNVPHAMNAMHTAFDDPSEGPNAVPRESIEARFFAFFD